MDELGKVDAQPTLEYKDPLDSLGDQEDYAQIAREAGYKRPEEERESGTLMRLIRQAFEGLRTGASRMLNKEPTNAKAMAKLDVMYPNPADAPKERRPVKLQLALTMILLGTAGTVALAHDSGNSGENSLPQNIPAQWIPGEDSTHAQSFELPTSDGPVLVTVAEPIRPDPRENILRPNSVPTVPEPTPTQDGFTPYQVQPGDTLYAIGEKLGVAPENLARFAAQVAQRNNIPDPDKITAFETIYLPEKPSVGP